MRRFNFFESTFAPWSRQNLNPCGVSSFFCESTFAPWSRQNLNPCGVSSFFCESTFAPWSRQNLNPCGVSSVFCESTFALWSHLNPCGVSSFFVSRPSHPEAAKTLSFKCFLWINLRTLKPPKPKPMWRFKFSFWNDVYTQNLLELQDEWQGVGGGQGHVAEAKELSSKLLPCTGWKKGGLDAGVTRPPFAHQCKRFTST